RLVAGGKAGSIGENLQLLFTDLAKGFLFVGLALACAGLCWAWRRRRAEGIALAIAFLVAGPVFMMYARPSYAVALSKGVYARFFILPSIPLAVLAGLGAWWVLLQVTSLSRPALRPGLVTAVVAAALLAVPAASAVVHYGTDDQSGNDVAERYADDV